MTELQWIRKELNERMTQLAEGIAAGQCQGFDDYRRACGELRGLEYAMSLLTEIQQRQEKHDDE